MIVCSCNILSDHDIRAIARDPDYIPPRVAEIYNRLGCSAACGRCARTIKTIIDEALDPCANTCCSDANSQLGNDEPAQEPALAAS
jgi:bacterioferritin-associated ferredoxin